MGKVLLDLSGVVTYPVRGFEEDCLVAEGMYIGIGDLLAGATPMAFPPGSVYMSALATGKGREAEPLATWRRESGKEWPPVFRIKIEFEASPLNEEETTAFWLKCQKGGG